MQKNNTHEHLLILPIFVCAHFFSHGLKPLFHFISLSPAARTIRFTCALLSFQNFKAMGKSLNLTKQRQVLTIHDETTNTQISIRDCNFDFGRISLISVLPNFPKFWNFLDQNFLKF